MKTGRSFETVLVEQCAPTLAGMKPGSLFRFSARTLDEIRQASATWNQRLAPLGVRVMILKECPVTDACMIYVYRPTWLAKILHSEKNAAFLREEGYRAAHDIGLLAQLSARLCMERDFPHEIGLFLGYPLEDVVGFIKNRGWNFTLSGYWKVYGDPAPARRRFAGYRACTASCMRRFAQGEPVTALVAA